MDLQKIESWADWKIALAFTGGLRVFYSLFAAVLSFFLHPDPVLIRSNAFTQHLPAPGNWSYALLGVWERFDTLWYLHIANNGYDLPMAVISYPLYPAAIRLLNSAMPAIMAALVISTTGTFFFFWGLLRLANADLSDSGRVRMLALVCVWPTSFILFAAYADSLTCALVVWAVVLARERRWWISTTCGILAGLSRPSGVVVLVPLFWLALRSRRPQAAVVALAPIGTLGYWAWLHWSGRISVVHAYAQYQNMVLASPWTSVTRALRLIFSEHDSLLAINLGLVILVVVLALRSKATLEDRLLALAVVLQILLYTGRPLQGAARYLMVAYPTFLALGRYAERWPRRQFVFYVSAFGFLNLVWMRSFLEWSLTF